MGVEDVVPKQVSGMIPHFWFDILGRIVPGGFLLVGLFSEDWHKSLTEFVHKFAADFPLTTHSVGFFLLFSATSFFVGNFLGVLSYYFIDRPVAFFWPIKRGSVGTPDELPIPEMLKTWLKGFESKTSMSEANDGASEASRYERMRKHDLVVRQSDALGHWLWIRCPELAVLVSRWGADSLAGRSVAVASAILLVIKWPLLSWTIRIFLLILLLCGVSTYHYYRNKVATRVFYFSRMFESSPAGEPQKAK